jgi:hypothetical protein
MRGLPNYEERKNKRDEQVRFVNKGITTLKNNYYNKKIDEMLYNLEYTGQHIFFLKKGDDDDLKYMPGLIQTLEPFLKDYNVKKSENFNMEEYQENPKESDEKCMWKPFDGNWRGGHNPYFAVLIKFQD